MKTKRMSIIFMVIASLCFLISFIVTMMGNEASGYRLYLLIISGLIFLILAWRTVIINTRKTESEEIK
jgi:hypothetical protein